MDFPTFLSKASPGVPVPKCLIALDPGETTGWALFHDARLTDCGELPTHTIKKSLDLLTALFDKHNPERIVYEDYRIYGWKTQSHSWDALFTPRLIGCLQTMAAIRDLPWSTQMAQQPKQFCTDDKLKMWGMHQKGMRHARDAIRHGTYYMLFNHKKYI